MPLILLKDPYRSSKLLYRIGERFRRGIRHRIFSSIERGNDDEALHFASARVLIRSRNEWGLSPLVAAINADRSQLVSELIHRGGMLEGDGAIAHAAMGGNLAIVELLLAANKNPNESLPAQGMAHDGYTPLMWATNRKYVSIVKVLLEAGADVNAVASDGTTAVMLAADAKPTSLEVLEILCGYMPDVTRKDWRGRSVVDEARDRCRFSGKPEMREILERHYPHINFDSV